MNVRTPCLCFLRQEPVMKGVGATFPVVPTSYGKRFFSFSTTYLFLYLRLFFRADSRRPGSGDRVNVTAIIQNRGSKAQFLLIRVIVLSSILLLALELFYF